MAEDKFDVYYSTGGDGGGLYNLESEINNYGTIVSNLRKMMKLREKVIQEMEKGRESTEKSRMNLFNELDPLISNWKGQYPDLGKLFRREQMDWLLTKYAEFIEMPKVIKTNLLNFVIECGYKDKPDVDEKDKSLLRRTTPLHYAAISNRSYIIFALLKIYDVDCIDEYGYTPFHVACKHGCYDVVEKFLELGQDPNCLLQKSVNAPLLMALYRKHLSVAELLLKNGANPNLTNKYGLTLLHAICLRECDDDLVELFFKMCDDNNHPLQVDARNKSGDTPLHLAVDYMNEKAAKLLLKRGADPNAANPNGQTPLHFICWRKYDDDFIEQFLQLCDDSKHSLQVDARNKSGDTPLHLAVCNTNDKAVILLLERGHNPNIATRHGSTSLHLICKRNNDDATYLINRLFSICDYRHQMVQVDAKDNSGWTPLQWAVAYLRPNLVEVLLDNGAKLSNFIFPPSLFNERTKSLMDGRVVHSAKLVFVLCVRAVVKCLEKRGYKLKLQDIQTIKRLFDKYGVFEKLTHLDLRWYDKEEFSSKAKKIEMSPSQSLYDLVRSSSERTEEVIVIEDYYYKLVSSIQWAKLPEKCCIASTAQLCEILAREFLYRRRAIGTPSNWRAPSCQFFATK